MLFNQGLSILGLSYDKGGNISKKKDHCSYKHNKIKILLEIKPKKKKRLELKICKMFNINT